MGVTIDFSKLYNTASDNRVIDVTPGHEEEDVEDPSLSAGRAKVQEGLVRMGVTLSAEGPDAEAAADIE